MTSSRNCVRCGKALEDAASMERGIGPVCRKLDNRLFAASIPANINRAAEMFSKINTLENAEVVSVLTTIGNDLMDTSNNDWRETVKRIEWVLSHTVSPAMYNALIGVTAALGYIGLVALWLGEAATGLAMVAFEGNRLYVAGPRNKAAQMKIKTIPGRMFHPAVGAVKARWSVPAKEFEKFELAIKSHYPNNEGLTEAIAAAVDMVLCESEIQPPAPAIKKSPEVLLTVNAGVVAIKAPYNANFVAAIKTLPYKARSWDPVGKVWTVKEAFKTMVESMVAFHYKAA